jgi:UDP-glucuronate 4-epimerase
MNILVTGAAGFFGSNLCEHLLENGHLVIGVDNFNSYYSPTIKEYNIREFKDHANFKLYRTDILDKEALDKIFAEHKIASIVHLAAWAGVTYSIDNPAIYIKTNVEGTNNMAEMGVKYKVKSFIYASTSSVYGSNSVPFTEDMPVTDPKSPYPVTKYAGELLLKTYSMNFGLPVVIFRIFNPQGKRMRPDLALSKLIRSCEYGTEFPLYQDLKTSGRDYCYIGHMFEAIDYVIKKPFKFEIFNLGNSSPIKLGDFLKSIEMVTGKKINYKIMPHRKGEMDMTYANIDKAKKMLGYNPTTSITNSIKIFYDWYLKQDENYKKGQL